MEGLSVGGAEHDREAMGCARAAAEFFRPLCGMGEHQACNSRDARGRCRSIHASTMELISCAVIGTCHS